MNGRRTAQRSGMTFPVPVVTCSRSLVLLIGGTKNRLLPHKPAFWPHLLTVGLFFGSRTRVTSLNLL
ncbi:MAG: hypothetical protein A2170_00295 [Deltaproteobacteria bacterium RBG_13_53_10]|nr:MAG: hypothetical protein A2170_00295 [Deltaproteobacteria bacterium RBG_13_53_10]